MTPAVLLHSLCPKLSVSALGLALLAGCGEDCRKGLRDGDFEFSQGNYPRALAHYRKAESAEGGACRDAAGAKIKMTEEISAGTGNADGLPGE